MSWKILLVFGCAFGALPIIKGQEQCMDMVQNFYEECSPVVNMPDSSCAFDSMRCSFSIRPVASKMVLLNQLTIGYLRQGEPDSLFNAYSAVVFQDTIIYGRQCFRSVDTCLLGSGCDGVEYQNDEEAAFYSIASLSGEIMEEVLGVIVFDSCASMRDFYKKVVFYDSCGWELPKQIPQNEEITKRIALVLDFDSKQILFLKTGVRDGSDDIEYLYSCIIDVKVEKEVWRMGYLSNAQCLEGCFYGF